jgi:acyl-coenzyme A thioesterase PaaI-like protein
MHVTDLAINKAMGMQLAPAGSAHVLDLPESLLLINHVGTVHASVQFALAEACSGEFLLGQLGEEQKAVFAVLRASEVKFRKPARGALRASARFVASGIDALLAELTRRGRAVVSIQVEVSDPHEVITMTGQYDWFLQRQGDGDE